MHKGLERVDRELKQRLNIRTLSWLQQQRSVLLEQSQLYDLRNISHKRPTTRSSKVEQLLKLKMIIGQGPGRRRIGLLGLPPSDRQLHDLDATL